ncbi:MAG: M56 family metallopeptidase [Roseburia sp.]|nr:M56 family metallopeptidase [Roseburia sp.]
MTAYNALLSTVLRMSLTGSVAIAAVLLVRLVLRRVPRIFSYLLWSVVLLRLLCPASFSSALSIFRVIDAPPDSRDFVQEEAVRIPQEGEGVAPQTGLSAAEHPEAGGVWTFAETVASRRSWSLWAVYGLIWPAGVAALWIYGIVSGCRLRRRLVGAVPDEGNIYLCDYIETAFVRGVLRPRIWLPTALTEEERAYILLHERTHIRRGDPVWRLLAYLALSVHWFNPLVWCAFFLSERDMEMSCDETVLRSLGADVRADYSALLLNLASGRRGFAGAPLGFGEGNVRCRIKNIMRYKRTAAFIGLLALAVVAIVFVVLGSNPTEAEDAPQEAALGRTQDEPLVLPEQIAVTTPVIDENMICGADGPILDYADERRLIFHDYYGLFVYNTEENKLTGAIDLEPIGCQYTQGDSYCEVQVSKDGRTVYMHPINLADMYVYETAGQTLTRQPYDMEGVETFEGLRATSDCVAPDFTVLRSADCVPLSEERWIYLESGSGMAAGVYYIVEWNGERVQMLLELPEEEKLGGKSYDISPEEAAIQTYFVNCLR